MQKQRKTKTQKTNQNQNQSLTSEHMGDDANQSNTIIQQIKTIAMTPLSDKVAIAIIEDHKYLLESIENRCAFAFFAVQHRNQCLYEALQSFYRLKEKLKNTQQ